MESVACAWNMHVACDLLRKGVVKHSHLRGPHGEIEISPHLCAACSCECEHHETDSDTLPDSVSTVQRMTHHG